MGHQMLKKSDPDGDDDDCMNNDGGVRQGCLWLWVSMYFSSFSHKASGHRSTPIEPINITMCFGYQHIGEHLVTMKIDNEDKRRKCPFSHTQNVSQFRFIFKMFITLPPMKFESLSVWILFTVIICTHTH